MAALGRIGRSLAAGVLLSGAGIAIGASTAAAATPVSNEAQLRAAFADTTETAITLTSDVTLTDCAAGELSRAAAGVALVVDGGGFTIRQTCDGARVVHNQGAALTLDNVTITGGRADGGASIGSGGGVYNDTAAALTLDHAIVTENSVSGDLGGEGGGVVSNGSAAITHSTISFNRAVGGTSIFGGFGGGVLGGAVTITDSTIANNAAGGAVTGGGDTGGAVGGDSVVVVRSTVSGNTAEAGSTSGSGSTGGIATNGDLTVVNSTITGNTAAGPNGSGGGTGAAGKTVFVYSTASGNSAAQGSANIRFNSESADVAFASVIVDPLGGAANCGGGAISSSAGDNYSDDSSCGFTNTAGGDRQSAADPLLGVLADNGGPTLTMLPQPGSPLLDAVATADCQAGSASGVTTDQRGITRPQGTGCDIGAVEVFVAAPTTTSVAGGSTTTVAGGSSTTTVPGTSPPATPVEAQPTFTG
jgi:hypothetical protein